MPKLRHLAILTHQPEKIANFYKHVFEMKELYRTKNGSVHLSDGEVNLAILNANDPKEPGHPAGLYHFGLSFRFSRRRSGAHCQTDQRGLSGGGAAGSTERNHLR
jgi:catechol-2,3-dioxygenase